MIRIFAVSLLGPFLSATALTLFYNLGLILKIQKKALIYTMIFLALGSINIYYSRGPYVETLDSIILLTIIWSFHRLRNHGNLKHSFLIFVMVINALVSNEEEMRLLARVLGEANKGFKCIYLGAEGCLWHLKPIVCEMFICDDAQEQILNSIPEARQKWEEFKQLKKHFTWPDRPVLFDALEAIFIKAGYTSPLMYLHNSPGLLRVKQQAKL